MQFRYSVLKKAIVLPEVPTRFKKKGKSQNYKVQCSLLIEAASLFGVFIYEVVVLVLKKGTVQYFCPLLVQENRQND